MFRSVICSDAPFRRDLSGIPLLACLVAGCATIPWRTVEFPADRDPEFSSDEVLLRRDAAGAAKSSAGALLSAVVRLYQVAIRPALSGDCPFHPSCSNYAREALERHGAVVGLWMAADRLSRCHGLMGRDYPTVTVYVPDPAGRLVPTARFFDPPAANALGPAALGPRLDGEPPELLRPIRDHLRQATAVASAEERRLFFFALDLLREGDVFRAATELKRLIHDYRSGPLYPHSAFLSALTSIQASRFIEASETLRSVPSLPEPLGSARDYLTAYVHLRRGEMESCRRAAKSLPEDPAWQKEARALIAYSLLLERRYEEASAVLGNELPEWRERLARADISSRSPVLAGIFSAIVPGSGHAYAGRPVDGLASFLLTTLFAAATYEAFRERLEVAGAITGAIGIVFYSGGIFGAADAAHRFNADAAIAFARDCASSLPPTALLRSLDSPYEILNALDPR